MCQWRSLWGATVERHSLASCVGYRSVRASKAMSEEHLSSGYVFKPIVVAFLSGSLF